MKKHLSSLIFLGLLTASSVQAKTHSHHISFGPEWLDLHIHTHIQNVQVEGNRSMVGFHFGYEYLNPKAFYAGIDLNSAVGSYSFDAKNEDQMLIWNHRNVGLANLDFRLGYSLGSPDAICTLFLGTGCYNIGSVTLNRGFHEDWLYLSSGVHSLFHLNEVFSMGLNLKATKGIVGDSKFKNHSISVKKDYLPWGGEIGVPFIWSFNLVRSWTFEIEPYWSRLDFSQNQQLFGSKFSITAIF